MPGGAGTPGGYDGGSGSSSGGGGHQGGGGGDGGAAQRAAAQRAQAQLDADRLNASRAAAAAAKEAEAREYAREKAIQTAALTTKTKAPIGSPHKDTSTQIAEQKEIDLYGYQDAKAQAPTTFIPKTEPITIHGKDGSYTKEQPVKYSPTYYQDRSKIGGETWGERARESARPKSGIMGMIGKVAPFVLPALLPAKLGQLYSGYNQAKNLSKFANKIGLTEKDIMLGLTGNVKSNVKSNLKGSKFRDERTTLGKEDLENWEKKQDWSGIKSAVGGGGDGQGGDQAQVPKDVVTESIQKFTPDQMNMVKQKHSQLQGVIDSGVYQGRQLTEEEIQMLQQKSLDIQKLIEKYIVDPKLDLARGGIADLYRYGGFI
jgi:hypothetical protein